MNNSLQAFEKDNGEILRQLIDDYNPGHDDTQLRHFIIDRNGITDYGKYRQAIAEVHTHYEALKEHLYTRRKAEAEIKLLEAKNFDLKNSMIGVAQRELNDTEIMKHQMTLDSVAKSEKRNMNELTKMFAMAQEYLKKIAGKDRKELEKDFWIAKFSKMLAMNSVWGGNNMSGVMENITSLPEDMQKPLLEEYHRCQVIDMTNKYIADGQAREELKKLNP